MHLLFWLSLIPFATGWMGENHFTRLPTALYGVALLMPALPTIFFKSPLSVGTAPRGLWPRQ
jgi:uncharacterized membrane protein